MPLFDVPLAFAAGYRAIVPGRRLSCQLVAEYYLRSENRAAGILLLHKKNGF